MRYALLTLVISLGLLLSACGSSSDDDPTATTSAASDPTTAATSSESMATSSSPTEASQDATAEVGSSTESSDESSPTASEADASPTAEAPTAEEGSGDNGEPTKVTLALGFVPNVQFAPYYVALDRGYYADAGFDVEVQQGPNPDLLAQVGAGSIDFAVTSGDGVIPARAAGIPVRYVMAQFEKYPVGATAIAGNTESLTGPEDLEGLRVGVSQLNGSTYFGLLALLQAGGLTQDDIELITIGFTELEALTQDRIDVAMTYLVNEPVQARELGYDMEELAVADYVDMVSTGLVTNEELIEQDPDMVQRFVEATLKGLQDSLDDPDAAFEASMKRMPEITGDNVRIQRAVLDQAQLWQQPPADHPLGWTNPEAWTNTEDLLVSVDIIDTAVDPATFFTNEFVEGAAE